MIAIVLGSVTQVSRGQECSDFWPTCLEPTIPVAGCVFECQPGSCPEGFRCTIVFVTNVSGPDGAGCPGFVAALCLPEFATPDVNGDRSVNELDLIALIAAWGPCDDCFAKPCATDVDGDCSTGASDLLALLAAWMKGP